ncbi:MAG: cache domain-containing protein, partial [Arcobacter sp.]
MLSSTIIILFVATIIGIVLIKTEYSNFRTHIKSFKNTLIEREMFYIKTSVQNLKNDIDFETLSIINSKKRRIKNQSIIAYNLAYSLYKTSKHLSKKEQINLIKKSLREIAQEENDINYFVLNTKGSLLLNTDYPKNEGINFLDFEDLDGVRFINKMINANPNTQNFLDYNWYRPNRRITYSRHLKELDLIIGSASNLESNHLELTNKLLKKITLQSFNNDEFIFIYKLHSLNNIPQQSNLLIQKNIITSNKELEAVKELLIKTNYKANEAIYYDYNQKLFYATYIKEYRYFIAVGVNLSNINKIVKKETKISLDNLYKNIIKLIIIIIVMTIIFFFFSLLFTRKIEELFSQYRKRV